jgi:hypothetical protein
VAVLGIAVAPEVAPPEPVLVCAEAGTAKGRVAKLRVKAPAQAALDKLEGFIVKIPLIPLQVFNFLSKTALSS